MNQRRARYYLYRIYQLLKSDQVPILIKRFKRKRGETDSEIIWLNPNCDILPTFIHECLHVMYWNWCETKVERQATAIFTQLTNKQISNLLLRMSLAINKSSIH